MKTVENAVDETGNNIPLPQWQIGLCFDPWQGLRAQQPASSCAGVYLPTRLGSSTQRPLKIRAPPNIPRCIRATWKWMHEYFSSRMRTDRRKPCQRWFRPEEVQAKSQKALADIRVEVEVSTLLESVKDRELRRREPNHSALFQPSSSASNKDSCDMTWDIVGKAS